MSRGLGRVERKILEYLQLDKDCGGCEQIDGCNYPEEKKTWNKFNHCGEAIIPSLCCYVEGKATCPHKEDWLNFIDQSRDSTYKSVLRAVGGLERKGYVAKERRTVSLNGYGISFLVVNLM